MGRRGPPRGGGGGESCCGCRKRGEFSGPITDGERKIPFSFFSTGARFPANYHAFGGDCCSARLLAEFLLPRAPLGSGNFARSEVWLLPY